MDLKLQAVILIILGFWTGLCIGQVTHSEFEHSQETTNAILSMRVDTVEATAALNKNSIERLSASMEGLSRKMDQFVGIGIGFGAALTTLISIQTILAIKYGPKRSERNPS